MAKYCIFCGAPPIDKNKEHVIPRWLIEFTGDPKRTVRFGLIKSATEDPIFREFAFDQFTFPACEACNTKYSFLESVTKSILMKCINKQEISGQEISILLDWFDKVRIGLWLAFHQLDKNFCRINPNFYIESRIGQFDRLLYIEKSSSFRQRLNFSGVDTLVFGFMPSAFSLMINDFIFTNISTAFLLSRRLGFPFPEVLYKDPNSHRLQCTIMPPRERIMRPIIKRQARRTATKLYQPMFPQTLLSEKIDYYNNDYIKLNSMNHNAGIGSIFYEPPIGDINILKSNDKITIDPPINLELDELSIMNIIEIHEWQNWLLDHGPKYTLLQPEDRCRILEEQNAAKRLNDFFINHHKKVISTHYTKNA